jgi:uncharacterized membrane protein (DUF106 family)
MSFFNAITGIFSNATAKIVDSIGNAVDRNLTTDHERLQVEAEVQKVMAEVQGLVIKANEVEQQEITKRMQADMRSDNKLSKNIRPMSLIFVTGAVVALSYLTVFSTLTEDQISVLDSWVDLWTAVMLTVYGFYFGSRGLEKVSTSVTDYKLRKEEKQ